MKPKEAHSLDNGWPAEEMQSTLPNQFCDFPVISSTPRSHPYLPLLATPGLSAEVIEMVASGVHSVCSLGSLGKKKHSFSHDPWESPLWLQVLS